MTIFIDGKPRQTAGNQRAKALQLNPKPRQTNSHRLFMVAPKNSEMDNYVRDRIYSQRTFR